MKKFFVGILALTIAGSALASNEVSKRDVLRKTHGLTTYTGAAANLKDVKVAVLDNGFQGYSAGRGLLPEITEMPTLTQLPAGSTAHGLTMAQIIWAMTDKTAAGPKMFLMNTNGFSNLKASIDYIIQQKIDIVLYAQVWPFGGNFDGTGFINEQVNRATKEGIIWINAAGNNGKMINNGNILKQTVAGDFLKWNGLDHLRFENKYDENQVTLTLSWTDFQASENYLTNKDLDVFVYDENEKLVGSGELIQRGEAPPAGATDSKLSAHARESITLTNLDRGKYKIKIKANSHNFDSDDRYRILLKSDKPITFTDKSSSGEIMPPADNPNVITVGESADDSAKGPTADGRAKPEIIIPDATVEFSSGSVSTGTSNAAAIMAGIVTVMKAQEPKLTSDILRNYVTSKGGGSPAMEPSDASLLDPWIKGLTPVGSTVYKTKRGGYFVILTPNDPLTYTQLLQAGASRVKPDDMILASPNSKTFGTHDRNREFEVNAPWVEFRHANSTFAGGSVTWKTPTPTELKRLIK